MREYKEDSTRGKARPLPVNYKGDVLAQAWIDARQLAVLSVWLDNNGYVTRHLSDVVRITIEEVASKLIDSGTVRKIEFTKEARALLMSKYRATLNPSNRGKRNLLHNLHLDELRQSNAYRDERSKVGHGIVDTEAVERSIEIYKQKEKEEADAKLWRDTEEQKRAAMKSGRVVKIDKPVINVDENVKKMQEYDEKLKDMP
jgi:hypothetical protein